jgi:hypothetical protein
VKYSPTIASIFFGENRHRISCFRDDVVFFVYLYQRWAYPVDTSRAMAVEDMG